MKYLLVLLVVGLGLWMLISRARLGQRKPPSSQAPKTGPLAMVQCAHCGLHLAATEALPEGSRLYCSDAHRRLGPAANPPPGPSP